MSLPPLPSLPLGQYRHYKGQPYRVLGLARHSESLEVLVIYQQLYGDHGTWVRPYAMFTESVSTPSGLQPRFSYEGPAVP